MESRGAAEALAQQGNTAAVKLNFIISHAEAIEANVDLNTLVPKLFNNNLLTPKEREELLYERESYPHVRKKRLVDFLSQKGKNVPTLFIKSLHEATSHLPHAQLADILEHALQCLQQPSAANSDHSSVRRAPECKISNRDSDNFGFTSVGSKRPAHSEDSLEQPPAKVPKLDSSASICRQFLNSCATVFEVYLDVITLLPHLLELQLLTHHEEESLTNDSYTRVKKIQQLLMFIKQKGKDGLLKFMQAIGQEMTHSGHKELYGILTQNLSQQVQYQELCKAVMDTKVVSKKGASSADQASGKEATHEHEELTQKQNEHQQLCQAVMAIDSQVRTVSDAGTSSTDPLISLANKLRQRYTSPKWSTINACDPKTHINLFVKLALIKKSKPSTKEMLTDKFFQTTLHGLIDDILQKKQSIEIENLFSKKKGQIEKLLVDGAPGIGKTQLACYLCTMWAKGELLNQYELVIFIRLRRFQAKFADKEFELYDLIKLYLSGEAGKCTAEKLALCGCLNTLFILDGWDELLPSLRQEFSFFHSIISGDSGDFHNASVMVTSRSTVSSSLRPYVAKDKHIEVLGFDSEQVKEYVSLSVPQHKEIVLSHFNQFPNIQALSHIPLTLNIICSIVQGKEMLPSTLTPLYDIYIRRILLANLKKYQELSTLPSLKDLPTEILGVIKSLARLAWKGLEEDNLVFERNDLEEGLDIKVPPNFDGYGLLMSIPYDDGVGDSCLYQFCHLTVQEYLAAWYIVELGHAEKQMLFDEKRFDYNARKYHVVWKFFSGLTKLSSKSAQEAIISKTKIKSNEDVMLLLHCVYEASDPDVCAAAAAHLRQELHVDNKQLNAVDCLCIAYMLANAGGEWTLNMRGCNMGTDGFNTLYSNLLRQQSFSHATPVTTASFSTLDVSHNYLHLDIDPSGIHKIAEFISGPFVIKDLWLDHNGFGDQKIIILAQAMHSNSTISLLSLANCDISYIGAKSLAGMLLHNKFLKGLFLKFNKICDVGAQYFAEALKINSTLSVLQLGNNRIKENGFKDLCDMLKVNSGLRELRIEGIIVKQIQAHQIVDVLPYNNHLEVLELKKSGIGDNEVKILADGIKLNPGTTLRRLSFKGCNVTDVGVKVLCEVIADGLLEGLQLGGNHGITDVSVQSFSEVLANGTLKRLRLENCRISEEGQAILQKFELDVTFIENVEQDRELRGTGIDSNETSFGRRSSF